MSILSMENVNYSYEKMNKKVLRNVSDSRKFRRR